MRWGLHRQTYNANVPAASHTHTHLETTLAVSIFVVCACAAPGEPLQVCRTDNSRPSPCQWKWLQFMCLAKPVVLRSLQSLFVIRCGLGFKIAGMGIAWSMLALAWFGLVSPCHVAVCCAWGDACGFFCAHWAATLAMHHLWRPR